jgi:hypothetical protein
MLLTINDLDKIWFPLKVLDFIPKKEEIISFWNFYLIGINQLNRVDVYDKDLFAIYTKDNFSQVTFKNDKFFHLTLPNKKGIPRTITNILIWSEEWSIDINNIIGLNLCFWSWDDINSKDSYYFHKSFWILSWYDYMDCNDFSFFKYNNWFLEKFNSELNLILSIDIWKNQNNIKINFNEDYIYIKHSPKLINWNYVEYMNIYDLNLKKLIIDWDDLFDIIWTKRWTNKNYIVKKSDIENWNYSWFLSGDSSLLILLKKSLFK